MGIGSAQPDGSFQPTNVAPGQDMLMGDISKRAAGAIKKLLLSPSTVAGEDVMGVTVQDVCSGFARQGRSCLTCVCLLLVWRDWGLMLMVMLVFLEFMMMGGKAGAGD